MARWRSWFLTGKLSLAEVLGSSRADVFVADGRPQFLEFNFGTCLNGGTTSSVLSSALLKTQLGAEFTRTHQVAYGSHLGNLVRWVRRQLPRQSPRVALLGITGDGDEGSLRWAEHHAANFAPLGVACDFVPIDEAELVDGSLTWRGKRYDGAIRYFMITPKIADYLDFIIALESAESTMLFGGYVAQLFSSKGLL